MARNLIDETGNRFGKLLVLKRAESGKDGRARWLCRCDCGNEAIVRGNNLRRGNTQSCGCMQGTNHGLPSGEAAFHALINRMKGTAKRRGIKWDLTKEQIRRLTKQPCFYCGVEPAQICSPKTYNGAYIYNGLDRINNECGYEINNLVPCCKSCNRAKSTKTTEEFKAWAVRLYEHFASEGIEQCQL